MILNLESDKISTAALQFAYKQNTGTATCTWAVTAIVDHFTRNRKPVFACAMFMSKAFDMVKWGKLFIILYERGVHPIIIRLLIYIYRNQQYTVK